MKKHLAIAVMFALCEVGSLTSQIPGKTEQASICFTPKADHTKFRGIMDAKEWKNPFLIVVSDGARLVGGFESSTPIESVPNFLRSLPCSAWPYGRIVAISESGLRAVDGDNAAITKNRLKLKKLLEKNGIEVDQWPS